MVAPGGRRTERLTGWLTHVAFALGRAPGARLLRALGVAVCGDRLLARIRAAPLATAPAPRALSVDDFALRRGRTYGMLLIDLDRRRVVDLLLVRPERQTPATRRALAQLRALHPEVRATAALVEGFAGLLRGARADLPGLGLRRWEGVAVRAGLPEFAAFVAKLRKDAAAVRVALVLPYSQGQIEGQITRVKLLKRAMYGRAKLDLLRQRVLYAAP